MNTPFFCNFKKKKIIVKTRPILRVIFSFITQTWNHALKYFWAWVQNNSFGDSIGHEGRGKKLADGSKDTRRRGRATESLQADHQRARDWRQRKKVLPVVKTSGGGLVSSPHLKNHRCAEQDDSSPVSYIKKKLGAYELLTGKSGKPSGFDK